MKFDWYTDQETRDLAVHAFSFLGLRANSAAPELMDIAFYHKDGQVRSAVARALNYVQPEDNRLLGRPGF